MHGDGLCGQLANTTRRVPGERFAIQKAEAIQIVFQLLAADTTQQQILIQRKNEIVPFGIVAHEHFAGAGGLHQPVFQQRNQLVGDLIEQALNGGAEKLERTLEGVGNTVGEQVVQIQDGIGDLAKHILDSAHQILEMQALVFHVVVLKDGRERAAKEVRRSRDIQHGTLFVAVLPEAFIKLRTIPLLKI